MIDRLSLQATGTILLAALGASALVTAGCSSDTQSGGTGSGGGSSQTSSGTDGSSATSSGSTSSGSASSGSAGTGGGPTGSSIALLQSQLMKVVGVDQSGWLAAGEKLAPTTLFVILSSEANTCAAPKLDLGTATHRLVFLGLPEAMQKVGTYDLASTDVIAFGDFWLSDGMGNGGGGKKILAEGTVEVVSLDAATITVRLAGLSGDFDLANGDHPATRCP